MNKKNPSLSAAIENVSGSEKKKGVGVEKRKSAGKAGE